jgi:hypothetical protein
MMVNSVERSTAATGLDGYRWLRLLSA